MSHIVDLFNYKKGSDDDEDDKKRNEYYAGGAGPHGGSGVSVLGNDDGSFDSMIRRAQMYKYFVFRVNRNSGGGVGGIDDDAPRITKTVTLYSNGFRVDDGPLRKMDDPKNRQFIEALSKEEYPQEWEEESRKNGIRYSVALNDKRSEEYIEPFNKFTGKGQSLGSTQHTPVTPVVTEAGWKLVVDDSQPKTTLQFRLMNGKRVTQSFNLTHTIKDIQEFVLTQTPGEQFVLLGGYPPKALDSVNQTIKEAGLEGSAITQRKC